MSTQAISSLSENLTPFTAEVAEERREQPKTSEFPKFENQQPGAVSATLSSSEHLNSSTGKSACATHSNQATALQTESQRANPVFDGPWKVAIEAEPEMLPPGVIPGPQPHESISLPWRPGDVARLKDDSPEGMMRYIATHTTGWWQDMALRALRDTEKAERMAEQMGIRPGQYWTVVVDAEAKERMLAAQEAQRVREEAERARVEAEREAFAQRQLELLEKAGKAPRCEYVFAGGRGCRAPQVRGERWCHGHAKMMSYRPEKLEVLPLEDEESVTVTLYRTVTSLLSGAISEKVAGLVLWSVAIKAPGLVGSRVIARDRRHRRDQKRNTHHGGTETRRKSKRLPQINADARGSEEQSALSNQHSAHDRVSRQRSAAEQAPHARQNKIAEDPSCQEGSVRGDSNPGVTRRKSSKSGVATGGRGKRTEVRTHGENASKRRGLNRHCRDLSTPPHYPSQAQGRSESLKMTVGEEHRKRREHGAAEIGKKRQPSSDENLRVRHADGENCA